MTSSKSMGCWPSEETFTMRAGLLSIIRGRNSGEIIDGEAQLKAILTGFSLPARTARADASIVDKDVETIALLANHVREATYLGKRRKIRRQEHCRAQRSGPDLLEQLLTSVAVPPVD